MASYHDLLDAIARVRSVTGDPDAWKKGLTGDDVAIVCTPASPPAALGAVLAKVTAAHPEVFLADSPAGQPPPRIGEGAAAAAIRDAEAALARQNTDAAHVDLQVVTAVLNAHAAHDDGLAELIALQHDIENAVVVRTDLDTPAGAREFQRFLIGKLRDIRDVVENSSLDATSKASLAAALAILYASSTPESGDRVADGEGQPDPEPAPEESGHHRRPDPQTANSPTLHPSQWDLGPEVAPASDAVDPLPPELAWFDPPPSEAPFPPSVSAMPAPAMPAPAMPAPVMPAPAMAAPTWGAGLPGGAPIGGGLPGLGSPVAPAPALPDLPRADLPDHAKVGPHPSDAVPETDPLDGAAQTSDEQPGDAEPADGSETEVNLPDGDTVTAPSPELAAAITAAVGGTPIPDAFRLHGITIPAPGSAVTAPLEPARLTPGDIGVFTDRHALALGHGKALLDKQIQPIASVSGPGFLGWQHPPAPQPANATPEVPAPNPAAATAPS